MRLTPEEQIRHRSHVESCVGKKCVEMEFWCGTIAFRFSNGVEIKFGDGFSTVTVDDDSLSGGIYNDKVVKESD